MATVERICSKCSRSLPLSSFWLTDKVRGYYRGSCKDCDKAAIRVRYATSETVRAKAKANSRRWGKENPRSYEQQRKSSLKFLYGITVEHYDAMLTIQSGRCALCNSPHHGRTGKDGRWKCFMVDHCHETGRVRGLLCHKCNVRVGAYEGLMKDVGEATLLRYLNPNHET